MHPNNNSARVRVMPGNPSAPHENSRTPYVKVKNGDAYYNKFGEKVKDESESSHIPLEEFDFSVFKDLLK